MQYTLLADRVRYLLDTTGVNARAASRMAGYASEAYVGMLARGNVKSPRAETLRPLAKAFNVPFAWLAAGEGETPVPSLETGVAPSAPPFIVTPDATRNAASSPGSPSVDVPCPPEGDPAPREITIVRDEYVQDRPSITGVGV